MTEQKMEEQRVLGKAADLFGGHSLRAGLVTSAYEGGATLDQIADQTGHDSDTIKLYVRDQNRFLNNAATVAGL